MKQLAMRYNTIPITMQCDSIQHNAIRYDAMEKNMIAFISFGSDRQQIMN